MNLSPNSRNTLLSRAKYEDDEVRGRKIEMSWRLVLADTLGIAAMVVGAVVQLPQIWKTLRSHQFAGLSLPTYALHLMASALWIAYGALIGDYIVCSSSGLSAVYASTVLIAYVHWRRQKRGRSAALALGARESEAEEDGDRASEADGAPAS